MSTKYEIVKLSDIASIQAGRSLRGKINEVKDTGVALVQMRNMIDSGVDWQNCMSIELGGKAAPNWVGEGDILLLARGLDTQVALIDESINDIDSKVVTAPYVFIIRADEEKVTAEYLAWWLNREIAQEYFRANVTGKKSFGLSRSAIENTSVVLPPLHEQEHIGRNIKKLARDTAEYKRLIKANKDLSEAYALDMIRSHT